MLLLWMLVAFVILSFFVFIYPKLSFKSQEAVNGISVFCFSFVFTVFMIDTWGLLVAGIFWISIVFLLALSVLFAFNAFSSHYDNDDEDAA